MSKAYLRIFFIFCMIIVKVPVSPASEPGAVTTDIQRAAADIKIQQDALAVFHAQRDDKNESATLNNLGANYALLGEDKSAVESYGKAAALLNSTADIDERGRIYRKIGLIYAELGDHQKARDYYELALKDHEVNYDRKEMADDNAALGRSYAAADDPRNAMKYFQRSMSMNDTIGRTDYRVYDDVIYLSLEQDYAEDAKKLISSKSLSSRPSAGRYALYTNSHDEAKDIFQQCSDDAEKGRDAGTSLYCLTGLARSWEAQLDYDSAKSKYSKAFELVEQLRAARAGGRRTGFYHLREEGAWPRTEPYEGLVRMAQFYHGGIQKSFTYSELLRGRIFYEAVAKNYRGKYPEPIEPASLPLYAAEVIVEYEVMEPYALAYVIRNGEIELSISIDIGRKQLSELVGSYRAALDARDSAARRAKFNPQPGKQLYDLLLKPLLESRGRDGNKIIPTSAKIIIMPDEMLGLLPFEALVASYPENQQFKQGRFGPVPVGIHYVGDDYDIGYSYSATALAAHRSVKNRKGNARGGLFVLADPITSYADVRLKGTPVVKMDASAFDANRAPAIAQYAGRGGTGDAGDSLSFPRLAGTGLLAKSLAKTFSGKQADALLGLSASEKELLGKDLSRYAYLVFATHGILDDNVPYIREPALVLNQAGNRQSEDGFLTMSEIMSLNLNAEVVALTASQTGRGKNARGEGVAELAGAFQYAGAKSILLSLWNVSDDSSNLLVDKFFQYVKQGKTARQSLRLAREQVRQAGYDHPSSWAPFVLYAE